MKSDSQHHNNVKSVRTIIGLHYKYEKNMHDVFITKSYPVITKSVISNVSLLNLKCNILLTSKKCKIVLNPFDKKKILKHISNYLKKKKVKNLYIHVYMLHGDLHIYTC